MWIGPLVLKPEFRAEAFSLTNHPEYGQPNTDLTNRNPVDGFYERQMQFALRLFF